MSISLFTGAVSTDWLSRQDLTQLPLPEKDQGGNSTEKIGDFFQFNTLGKNK